MRTYEEKLRSLALNDTGRATAFACEVEGLLDARTRAMVELAALVAMNGPAAAFQASADAALAAGANEDQLVDILITTLPTVGSAHVVAAAPKLAMALGYDIDAALEAPAGDVKRR